MHPANAPNSSSNTVTVINLLCDPGLLSKLYIDFSQGNDEGRAPSPSADFGIRNFHQSKMMVVELVQTGIETARPAGGRLDEITITLKFAKWVQSSQDSPSGIARQNRPATPSTPIQILDLLAPRPHVPFMNAGYEADILVRQPDLFNKDKKEVSLTVQGYLPQRPANAPLDASQIVWTCLTAALSQGGNVPQHQVLLQAPRTQFILQSDKSRVILIMVALR
jgi:hypothetical protein